ncbi:hypothetical protein FZW96_21250 [Bacillus sp. BGMRC 2118]|nr:hypothetical protein FZW96_21250 [Bacillus sp. BGMRC 2118]
MKKVDIAVIILFLLAVLLVALFSSPIYYKATLTLFLVYWLVRFVIEDLQQAKVEKIRIRILNYIVVLSILGAAIYNIFFDGEIALFIIIFGWVLIFYRKYKEN